MNSIIVTNERKAYAEGGLERALNRKKLEREYHRRLDRNTEAHLIVLAFSDASEGYERLALRQLRYRLIRLVIVDRFSHQTIHSILKKRT